MHKITLLQSDRDYICTHGTPLNDKQINLAQCILKTQCPHVDGLQSTLKERLSSRIQVVHCHGNHWITGYKQDVGNDVMYIYDSVYNSIDNASRNILQSLFEVKNNFKVTMALGQKQERGSNNCGLFAVATATTIALDLHTTIR